jgi:hypothetical protein
LKGNNNSPAAASRESITIMPSKVLPVLNIFMTIAVLYLFKVYGSLCGWWQRLRSEADIPTSTFHIVADQIPIVVFVLLVLNLASAYIMWDYKLGSARLSAFAIVLGGIGVLSCLLIAF